MGLIIREHKSSSYGPRTYVNAADADVTIALAVDYTTAGERLTHKAAGEKYLKLPLEDYWDDNARKLWQFLNSRGGSVVNVAGNGIYTLSKLGIAQISINEYVSNF